jgi:uncharacterized membrane protein
MFRSVSLVALAALVFSLALDIFAPVGVAAHTGSSSAAAAETSVALLSIIERPTISEPSVLLLIGFALITVSRSARR